ncbi:MAG: hypothetical protein JXJ04_15935 [Spirochaetales bacterium]|nr:hypothetical protein [Spirochaetales bacterium]
MRKYTSFTEELRGFKKINNKELFKALFDQNEKNEKIQTLTIEEIIRWGFEIRLDMYRILLLILKVLWENFLADHREENEKTGATNPAPKIEEEVLISQFHPRAQDIYFNFQKVYKEQLTGNESLDYIDELHYGDYDERILGSLIQEMILNRLYFLSINSEQVNSFIQKKDDEQRILKIADEKKQQDYWIAKCVWVELQEELSELLMLLESSRLQNGYIMREFLKTFGDSYVELKEQIIRVLSLKRRMMLKDAHPEWSRNEIEKTVDEIENNEKKEIDRLKYSAQMADLIEDIKAEGSMDTESLNEYKKKVKKILKEVYFILHPHRLMHNPNFHKLTDKQRDHLKKLWEKVMDIKEYDLKYPEGTVGHYMHSLENLLAILDKSKKILAHSGLEINVGYIIIGETIEERIEWLNKEIKQLEKDIQNTKEDILTLKNNKDILEKKAALACPSKHNQVREEMLKRVEMYKKEASELEKQFESLFESDPGE